MTSNYFNTLCWIGRRYTTSVCVGKTAFSCFDYLMITVYSHIIEVLANQYAQNTNPQQPSVQSIDDMDWFITRECSHEWTTGRGLIHWHFPIMTGVHNECLYQWGRFSFRLADQTSQAMLGTSPLPISSEPLLLVSSYIDRSTKWFSSHLFVLVVNGFIFYPVDPLFHYIRTKKTEPVDLPPDVPWWRHQTETFPCYRPFVWGIHRSSMNSHHKGKWRETLMFSLICACTNSWVNNRDAGHLRRHRAHHDVTVM